MILFYFSHLRIYSIHKEWKKKHARLVNETQNWMSSLSMSEHRHEGERERARASDGEREKERERGRKRKEKGSRGLRYVRAQVIRRYYEECKGKNDQRNDEESRKKKKKKKNENQSS